MESIIGALVYADLFDYPLTKDEIFQWQVKTKRKLVASDELGKELGKLIDKKVLDRYRGYYFLKGRKEIVKIRKQREKWSENKIRFAGKIVKLLFYIPWIEFIGISGGVARKNADKGDDIDLFIITKNKRLWLTRGSVVLILKSLNIYRKPTQVTDKICPNMYLSENSMDVTPHDLYIAHEIGLIRPLTERNDAYRRFLMANSWVKEYLPNIPAVKQIDKNVAESQSGRFYIFDKLEKLSMIIQLKYLERHKTKEVVSADIIRFHPGDVRSKILTRYRDKMDSCFK